MSTQRTLVVMAAGLGSRFGGVKQLAAVGPDGEVILDYTIRDAVAAGVDQVVMIVRNDIKADTAEHLAAIHGPDLPVTYVCQDDLPPPRAKPWGTVHAVLAAADAVESPFILANADDYYGPRSFALAAERLESLPDDRGLLVTFEAGKTLPAHGSVTRGVCEVADGYLTGIVETENLQRRSDGTIGTSEEGPPISDLTQVSMNLWAFTPAIFAPLRERFAGFLAAHGDEEKSECLLPTEIGVLKDEGRLRVATTPSPETWTGITNPDDLETVRALIRELR